MLGGEAAARAPGIKIRDTNQKGQTVTPLRMNDTSVSFFKNCHDTIVLMSDLRERTVISTRPLAAADPPAAGQARLSAGEGLAPASGARRGRGQERGLCAARPSRARRISRGCWGDRRGGGEAIVCEARLVDGLSDREVRALFDAARDADYERSPKKRATLAATLERRLSHRSPRGGEAQLARLRALAQIVAIDFFGADGREAAEGCSPVWRPRSRRTSCGATKEPASKPRAEDLKGRDLGDAAGRARRPHRLRLADPPLHRPARRASSSCRAKGYVPEPGELRFDMFEAEFTHEGDRCTFEVLLGRDPASDDPALRAIAEIVHDIDLKDGKFGREEAAGIRTLIAGICAATARRRPAARARRRRARRPLPYFRQETRGERDERRPA